jgi:hypothetical protein
LWKLRGGVNDSNRHSINGTACRADICGIYCNQQSNLENNRSVFLPARKKQAGQVLKKQQLSRGKRMSKSIIIDGVEYVKKTESGCNTDGLPYVLIRSYSAGVHIGFLKEKTTTEVTLVNTQRLYSWAGACSLSQVALDGPDITNDNTKISVCLDANTISGWIEIIPMTKEAQKKIKAAKIWKK